MCISFEYKVVVVGKDVCMCLLYGYLMNEGVLNEDNQMMKGVNCSLGVLLFYFFSYEFLLDFLNVG